MSEETQERDREQGFSSLFQYRPKVLNEPSQTELDLSQNGHSCVFDILTGLCSFLQHHFSNPYSHGVQINVRVFM